VVVELVLERVARAARAGALRAAALLKFATVFGASSSNSSIVIGPSLVVIRAWDIG
jgi:hypothetical protein